MKSFPYLPLALCSILAAGSLTGCGTDLGGLKPGKEIPVTPAPTVSPAGGTFTSTQSVTIADSTAGATIYYTTDGSIPTQLSAIYTGPISVRGTYTGLAETISAIAVVPGQVQSPIGLATFTINLPQPTYTFKNVPVVGGGFVDGLFFHPAQAGLMYARTDVGGAYRWNTAAGGDAAWVPLTDFIGYNDQGFLLGVESIGLDPSDAQRLYLAMGEYADSFGYGGEFLLSDDQGKTFTTVNAPFRMGSNDNGRFSGERLAVDPNLGTNLWYGTRQNGLYNSTDRGMTWNAVTAFPVTTTTGTTADPGAGVIFETFVKNSGTVSGGATKTFYVGVSDPTTGLYVTNDGGATFTAVAGQPTGQYLNSYWMSATDGNLHLTYGLDTPCTTACSSAGPGGVTAGSVWRYTLPTSANPAGTFTEITPPDAGAVAYGYGSVVVDPNNPNTIMVGTLDRYYPPPADDIYRSTDGGVTWTSLDANIQRDSSISPWVNFNQPTAGPGNWINHVVIDPFNSNHAMYGTGQTVWETMDLKDADGVTTTPGTIVPANTTHWAIGAAGIEETVITSLAAPPAVTPGGTPPNELLATMGDLGSFSFPEAQILSGNSPPNGADKNPTFTTGTSVDYAGQAPLTAARVGTEAGTLGGGSPAQLGAASTDGGQTWTAFASNPATIVTGGGSIAVAADGSTLVWFPADTGAQAYYSTDMGATWTACSGSPNQSSGKPQILVYADRVNAKTFYILDPSSGNIYTSTNGGTSFNNSVSVGQAVSLTVSPAAAGDVWASAGSGLYQSVDGANTFTQVNPVLDTKNPVVGEIVQIFATGFGATDASQQSTYPTLYVSGYLEQNYTDPVTAKITVQSTAGVYRSIDEGFSWVRINDPMHQWGGVYEITGDPNIFGRVYMGTSGRGIIYGDSTN